VNATVSAAVLHRAVGQVMRAANPRGSVTILAGVEVTASEDGLALRCTNMDIEIHQRVVTAEVHEAGVAVVNAKALHRALAAVKNDTVHLLEAEEPDGDGALALVLPDGFTVRLPLFDPSDMPLARNPEGEAVTVAVDGLAEAVAYTLPFASKDQSRPVLTCVLLEGQDGDVSACATDSYRLARHTVACDASGVFRALVPADALAELLRLLPDREGAVTVRVNGTAAVTFDLGGGLVLHSRQVDGKFPDVDALIVGSRGKPATTLHVDRDDAHRRVARMVAAYGATDRDVARVAITGSKPVELLLGLNGPTARDQLPVLAADGTARIDMGVNAKFLADAFASFPSGPLMVDVWGPLQPFLLGDGHGRQHLLMPVRVA